MRLLNLTFILLFLTGCLSKYQNTIEHVSVADNVNYTLLPTIPFSNGLTLTQSATVTYQDESHDLIFHTEITNRQLTMVGLSPTGTRLFTIVMQEGSVNAEGFSSLLDSIKAEYLLADLQLSLWPQDQLNQNLSGAVVKEPRPLTRNVVQANNTIITVHYSEAEYYKGDIQFTHHQRGYNLSLTPLAIEFSNDE